MYKTRERKGYERGTARNFLQSFPLSGTPVVQSYRSPSLRRFFTVCKGHKRWKKNQKGRKGAGVKGAGVANCRIFRSAVPPSVVVWSILLVSLSGVKKKLWQFMTRAPLPPAPFADSWKNISLSMSFFTVSFSRFAPSRVNFTLAGLRFINPPDTHASLARPVTALIFARPRRILAQPRPDSSQAIFLQHFRSFHVKTGKR